jgi:glycosyltransferase involved in cell wall biosynthesis
LRVLIVGLATFEQMAGGSARYLSGLVAGLRRLGWQVEVHTAARHVPTVGYSQQGLAGQLRRALTRALWVMPRTFVIVLWRRPDLVNSHFALDGLPAVLAAAITRVPVVVTFHGPWAQEAIATGRRGGWPLSTRVRRSIESFVYRRAHRCIVLSRSFGEILVHDYGVRPSLISVIPGGIDLQAFADVPPAEEARRRLRLAERYTLVTVRRLVPRMGLDLAIDAVALLAPELDAQLVIAGSGPDRARLEAHAATRNVADRVRFLGRVADAELPLLYAAADVCVVPSRELEGFGYVALEALAAGTPVVAAGTGGLAELLGRLEPRWVVAADGAAIATAIRALRTEPDSQPDRAARLAYARSMDWALVLPRVARVFESSTRAAATGHPGRQADL